MTFTGAAIAKAAAIEESAARAAAAAKQQLAAGCPGRRGRGEPSGGGPPRLQLPACRRWPSVACALSVGVGKPKARKRQRGARPARGAFALAARPAAAACLTWSRCSRLALLHACLLRKVVDSCFFPRSRRLLRRSRATTRQPRLTWARRRGAALAAPLAAAPS